MTAEEKFMEEIKKAMANYHGRTLSECVKRGMAAAKTKRLAKLRDRLNDLLLEAEYDLLWHMQQNYVNSLNEKQLLHLIGEAEEQQMVKEAGYGVFPPEPEEAKGQ